MQRDDSRQSLICVSGLSGKILCYRADTLELLHTIPTAGKNCRIAAIPPADSDDGFLVATSQYDAPHETVVYNPRTKKLVRKLQVNHASRVWGLSHYKTGPGLSPSVVVSGDQDSHVYVSVATTGKRVRALKDPPKRTCRIMCFRTEAGKPQPTARTEPRYPEQLVFVSGGDGKTDPEGLPIRHYNLLSGKPGVVRKYVGHTETVHGLSFSGTDGLLLSTSADKTLKLWHEQSGGYQSTNLSDQSHSVIFEPETRLAFCGIRGGHIEAFDIRNMSKVVRKFRPHGQGGDAGGSVYDIIAVPPEVYRPAMYASVDSGSQSVSLWSSPGKMMHGLVETGDQNFGLCYVPREEGVGATKTTSSIPLPPPLDLPSSTPPAATASALPADPLMDFLKEVQFEHLYQPLVDALVTFDLLTAFLLPGGDELLKGVIPGDSIGAKLTRLKFVEKLKTLTLPGAPGEEKEEEEGEM